MSQKRTNRKYSKEFNFGRDGIAGGAVSAFYKVLSGTEYAFNEQPYLAAFFAYLLLSEKYNEAEDKLFSQYSCEAYGALNCD